MIQGVSSGVMESWNHAAQFCAMCVGHHQECAVLQLRKLQMGRSQRARDSRPPVSAKTTWTASGCGKRTSCSCKILSTQKWSWLRHRVSAPHPLHSQVVCSAGSVAVAHTYNDTSSAAVACTLYPIPYTYNINPQSSQTAECLSKPSPIGGRVSNGGTECISDRH